jgi:flagellar motor switch protein FliM
MPDELNQGEIDALLSSITGQPGEGSDASRQPAGGPEISRYDFRRPGRVSKEQIRALTSVHSVFARNVAVTLSGFLRTIVEVRVVSVEQLTYSEFIHSLPNPTCFMILRAPPLEGQMCLEMSPLIVFPIIDRLLGGGGDSNFIPQRPLTSIEWRLISRITERALEHLSDVWHNLVNVQFELVETESNPQLVHIVAPTEVVVFVTFEIKLGQNTGTMSLCVPFNTVETVLSHVTSQSWFYKPKPASPVQQQRLQRNLVTSTVDLTAFLGRATIRVSDLRSLRPGDLLPLAKNVSSDLLVRVAGRNKFAAQPGRMGDRRAIRLTRAAAGDEPL